MDEISLVNILNSIKTKATSFGWELTCKYDNGKGDMFMEILFYDPSTNGNFGKLLYQNTSGQVINGWYKSMPKFEQGSKVVDAVLDIMNYEQEKGASQVK